MRIDAADRQKARAIGADKLIREMRAQPIGAKTAEIDVEVAVDRHELADVDVGDARWCSRAAALETGRIVVARDVEPAAVPGADRGRRDGWRKARR